MKRFNLLLLALSLLLVLPASAQKRDISLTIGVTGPDGAALPAATVSLTQSDYALSYGTIHLNAQGQVTIKVYAGNHRLDGAQAGYNPAT